MPAAPAATTASSLFPRRRKPRRHATASARAAAPKLKNPPGLDNFSLRVDVPEVSVDVGVLLEKTGQFVPNLKPNNFKVYENGVEQKVIGFKRVEAPDHCADGLRVCFHQLQLHLRHANAAWAFAQQLRPQDYVA